MSLPKHKLELSLEAAQDLADILRYTAQTWGSAQQDSYEQVLDHGMQTIAQNPGIGRFKQDYGAYFYNIGRHVAIYIVSDDTVIVVRVLHGRMNPDNYL